MVKGEALLFLAGHFFFKPKFILTRFLLLQLVGSNVLVKPPVSTGGFLLLVPHPVIPLQETGEGGQAIDWFSSW